MFTTQVLELMGRAMAKYAAFYVDPADKMVFGCDYFEFHITKITHLDAGDSFYGIEVHHVMPSLITARI